MRISDWSSDVCSSDLIGVFCIDAVLDRPAGETHIILGECELFAGGDPDHLLDQVEVGHHLGDGMLDLEPRVHLQEVEASVRPGDELDGARREIADGLRQRDGLLRSEEHTSELQSLMRTSYAVFCLKK